MGKNTLLTEIAKREDLIIARDALIEDKKAKEEQRDKLLAEIAQLDEKISNTDVETLKAEIDELTGYAVTLGFIDVSETAVAEPAVETTEGVGFSDGSMQTNVY